MKLDFTGKACPIPVMQSKNALLASAPGEEFEIIVDNEPAAQNVARLLTAMAQPFEREGFRIRLQRAAALIDPFAETAAAAAIAAATAGVAVQAPGGESAVSGNFSSEAPGGEMAVTGNFSSEAHSAAHSAASAASAAHSAAQGPEEVLFLKSQRIGEGELGGMLAVGFLTAASARTSLRKIILINDAVLIACQSEHPAHEPLAALEAAGVEVICCANCLNYFATQPLIGRAGDALGIISTLFNGKVLSL